MWRKSDKHEQDMEDVVQRLRDERPEASPLELDRAKTSAMARPRSGSGARFGARRLVVAGFTVGLMAAGTGGVLAAGGGNKAIGNAASAQYSTTTTTTATSTTATTSTSTSTTTTTSTSTTQTAPGGGEPGSKTIHLSVHFPGVHGHKIKIKTLTITVNGKTVKVLEGKKANGKLTFKIPCSNKKITVVIVGVLSNGKTVRVTRHYTNRCKKQ
jgi:hypothetical protein